MHTTQCAHVCVCARPPVPAHITLLVTHTHVRACASNFVLQVAPTCNFSQNIGNSYTAALWTNLAGTVDNLGASLEGRRLGMFSYGSGALATMFVLDGTSKGSAPFSLADMQHKMDISRRLAARREATPEEFTEAMNIRERAYGKAHYTPVGSVDNVPVGGWYLKSVHTDHTRVYARKA